LYGTEPDAKLLVAARIACPSASLVSTCGELIPFEDGSFDAVLIECVFSLAESPVSIASEVSRVVRRQGILLLTDLYTQGETDLLIEQTPVAGSPIAESPVAESPVSGLPATELPVAGSPVAYDPLLRHIYTKRSIDAYFTKSGFTAERFLDCTRDMQSMFAQMILDGSADSYIDAAARKGLYDAKAGYGIWIYKKI
jgi:ubiquinone/menaquinone biosynthesis C-methylase UbiE